MNTINGEKLLVTDYILNISVRTTQDLYEDPVVPVKQTVHYTYTLLSHIYGSSSTVKV